MSEVLWLIPLLPMLAAVVVAILGPRFLKENSHWPVIAASAVSCFISLSMLAQLKTVTGYQLAAIETTPITWFSVGGLNVQYQLILDPISAIMLTAITFIGTWIAVFSVGYMHGDPGYPRFFAVLSAFLFFMCGLVLADNMLLLYACWEGVGLCSYLLIGFWFAKPEAAAAARKAFLYTRLGDAGLVLGIAMLWAGSGYHLTFDKIFVAAKTMDPAYLTTACLLLFCGAVGKSAQFPLHVWLPDAMEGPTPASALIHAATMVTAGVYLVARCMPLFHLAENALLVVACIGGFTAILAALIALTQNDLKRVMAYSTVSQLGLMFLALGSGVGHGAHFAVMAAIFHLFTHAFFKALLFLASGSVMHAMGGVLDMRRIGGLSKAMPQTHWTFLCGAASLAGFPLLSGFFSKDEIIAAVHSASHGEFHAGLYKLLYYTALTTAFLTAFYTFRAYFRTFWGDLKVPPEAGSHGHGDHHHHHEVSQSPDVHESPPVMTIPLVILAAGAVFVGLLMFMTHSFADLIFKTPSFYLMGEIHEHAPNFGLMFMSAFIAVSGIALAYVMYVFQPELADMAAKTSGGLYHLSQKRFYWDELYKLVVVIPGTVIAQVCRFIDMFIDGLVDLVGRLPSNIGYMIRPIQNGLVQFYALFMMLGLAVYMGILVLRGMH